MTVYSDLGKMHFTSKMMLAVKNIWAKVILSSFCKNTFIFKNANDSHCQNRLLKFMRNVIKPVGQTDKNENSTDMTLWAGRSSRGWLCHHTHLPSWAVVRLSSQNPPSWGRSCASRFLVSISIVQSYIHCLNILWYLYECNVHSDYLAFQDCRLSNVDESSKACGCISLVRPATWIRSNS